MVVVFEPEQVHLPVASHVAPWLPDGEPPESPGICRLGPAPPTFPPGVPLPVEPAPGTPVDEPAPLTSLGSFELPHAVKLNSSTLALKAYPFTFIPNSIY